MRFFSNILLIFALTGAVGCSKTISADRSPKSADKANAFSEPKTAKVAGVGSVAIKANTFTEDFDVTIKEISAQDFATLAGLSDPSVLPTGKAMSVSVQNENGTVLFPTKPISFDLDVPAGTQLEQNYFVLIVGKDANGNSIINYVAKDDLVVDTFNDGSKTVSVEKLITGDFYAAIVNGDPATVLGNSAIPLGPNGELVAPAVASVPQSGAVAASFTDTDPQGAEIAGTLNITKATDESDITKYVIYWGSSASAKANPTPIASIDVTGSNLTYNFASDTAIPAGATYLLVYSANSTGERTTPYAVLIVDLGVPTHAAVSLGFTDTDTDGGQIGGNVLIGKASDESDVTHYVLYWGSSATVKQSSTPIASIAVTGSNITHPIGANTAIPSSPAATHLLVYTKNAEGEMATGVSLLIVDKGVPIHAASSVSFTDTDLDGGQLGGNINIVKSSNESDVTHYVLYWGSNTTTKQNSTPIATVAKTGSNLTYALASNTAIPTGPTATHILVYTRNADGEMATGVNVAITDLGVPVNAATSVAFTDTDLDGGQLAGNVDITIAADESDVTHYVLYWGSSSTVKQNATPIATIAVTGSNVQHTFAVNTVKPTSPTATHLLVFTRNADGEMSSGVSVAIVDKGVPTHAAAGVSFTDTDTDSAELGGTVSITKASNESDITHYVLYWGSNSTTKQNATPIAQVAVTGSNVTYNIPADTPIPTSPTATHILVFTKNADGEMATGVSGTITDDTSGGGGSPTSVTRDFGSTSVYYGGNTVDSLFYTSGLDGQVAFVNMQSSPCQSEGIAFTNAGFSIPGGATITGIEVHTHRRPQFGDNTDFQMFLKKGSSLVGSNKATSGSWAPSGSPVDITYGGTGDLWGTTWTPAEINDTSFGFMWQVQSGNCDGIAELDYVNVTVYYTP